MSSTVRERVRTFLQPGEVIRYIFPATCLGPTYSMVHFLIVVTNLSITVLTTGLTSRTNPQSVWATYPVSTRLGPVDLKLAPEFTLGDLVFEVDEEYVSVINAADAETSSPESLPRDPHPDL